MFIKTAKRRGSVSEKTKPMGKRKNSNHNKKNALINLSCVLLAAVIITAVILVSKMYQKNVAGNERALHGILINGIDISGMNRKEALAATANVPGDILDKTVISIKTGGKISSYTAKDLGMGTDYEAVVSQALAYGHSGILAQQDQEKALKNGVNFAVKPVANKQALAEKLSSIKGQMDVAPVDASFEFMPRGFSQDGTKYEPDEKALIKACAQGKAVVLPDSLVRIPADKTPNKLRYEFYKETKLVKDYIPYQADISRFFYKGGTDGQSVDVEALAESIISKVQSGDYSTPVIAPVHIIKPAVTLGDIKKNKNLIASWTSSYAGHNGYNRNWNLSKLSGIINGVVIQPGEEWSINKLAGNRTKKAGWLDAPGIENGGYVDQPGGGVCQISSTLYNAAIRANLDITDSTHHSIISGYIPLGLDATISSGAPDLKIRNNQSTPVYFVSYTNPKDKNVTVEIFGQTIIDPQYGDVILDFSSKDLGSYGGKPVMSYVYNASVAPDGKAIQPGKSVVYAESRPGKKAETYKHILSPDGKVLKVEKFTQFKWKPINGTTYVNGPDPATLPPETSPSQSVEPQPPETASPSALQSLLDDLSQLGKLP